VGLERRCLSRPRKGRGQAVPRLRCGRTQTQPRPLPPTLSALAGPAGVMRGMTRCADQESLR
jgi:hypothetical protein